MRSSAELRRAFLEFFRQRGHEIVPTSPLVPANDPTLLFTNAGMVQFKEVFLGLEPRPYSRAATVQRCVRAGGKHNDLENVGYTARHHTFFEMLGNFSFGDYFKREAIQYAWEFLTGEMALPPEKLWVTVYEEDEDAARIWLDEIGVDPERFSRIGAHDNFWSMGDTGPCGPCSEIFYDHGPEVPGGPPGTPEEEGDRYVEIWNLVFMQYDRDDQGNLNPLPKPSVDTGMGLERLAAVMQGVHDNYEIDLFQSLMKAAAKLAGTEELDNTSLRVIADHIRSCAFLVADGVLPSNEGRGYVLRRIIRRAIRHGHKLGLRDMFFHRLVEPLEAEMGEAYPELTQSRPFVERVLRQEEERFAETLGQGMQILESELREARRFIRNIETKQKGLKLAEHAESYDGKSFIVFRSVDDKGPIFSHFDLYKVSHDDQVRDIVERAFNDLIKKEVKPEGRHCYCVVFLAESRLHAPIKTAIGEIEKKTPSELSVQWDVVDPQDLPLSGDIAFKLYDTFGFPVDMTADIARERGLELDQEGFEREMAAQRERARAASQFGTGYAHPIEIDRATDFTGYETTADRSEVVGLYQGEDAVEVLEAGEEGLVVLDHTPFYAESGGQVGDSGRLAGAEGAFEVADTQKRGQAIGHIGRVSEGRLKMGDRLEARVDEQARQDTAYNHSATHLLHAALRTVLGEHVQQKGSLVAPDRLRFDFSHFEPLSAEQVQEIERLVNDQIRANHEVQTRVTTVEDALADGAMALFGEKYGETVRMLRMGDFSIELCGGTHVSRTGDIGLFKVLSEGGVAAGVRRLEAVTGRRALEWVEEEERQLEQVAALLKGGSDE
ncbi:MAG TPA: alanine--tRNA ligase, partial [Gammaproteobacteria bacterium]|nr:alanine--tRNA ligase [Gammaproteobacteria bacterium]